MIVLDNLHISRLQVEEYALCASCKRLGASWSKITCMQVEDHLLCIRTMQFAKLVGGKTSTVWQREL